MNAECGKCHHSQQRKGREEVGMQIQATEHEGLKRTRAGTRKIEVSHMTGGRTDRV